jgi:hypothetical protein
MRYNKLTILIILVIALTVSAQDTEENILEAFSFLPDLPFLELAFHDQANIHRSELFPDFRDAYDINDSKHYYSTFLSLEILEGLLYSASVEFSDIKVGVLKKGDGKEALYSDSVLFFSEIGDKTYYADGKRSRAYLYFVDNSESILEKMKANRMLDLVAGDINGLAVYEISPSTDKSDSVFFLAILNNLFIAANDFNSIKQILAVESGELPSILDNPDHGPIIDFIAGELDLVDFFYYDMMVHVNAILSKAEANFESEEDMKSLVTASEGLSKQIYGVTLKDQMKLLKISTFSSAKGAQKEFAKYAGKSTPDYLTTFEKDIDAVVNIEVMTEAKLAQRKEKIRKQMAREKENEAK